MICQRLIPSCAGKRVPCLEIMKRNVGTQDAVARNDLALLASNIEERRRQFARHQFDTERLDRIRNLSKYVGR